MAQNLRIEENSSSDESDLNHQIPAAEAYDYTLRKSIAQLLSFHGFDEIRSSTLSTLTNTCQRLLVDLAKKSRSYAEISQRSQITDKDLFLTLFNESIDVPSLIRYTADFHDNKASGKISTCEVPDKIKALSNKSKKKSMTI